MSRNRGNYQKSCVENIIHHLKALTPLVFPSVALMNKVKTPESSSPSVAQRNKKVVNTWRKLERLWMGGKVKKYLVRSDMVLCCSHRRTNTVCRSEQDIETSLTPYKT